MLDDKVIEPALIRLASIAPRERGGGIRSWPLVNKALGATGFVNGVTEFDPGCTVPLHFHNCDESVLVLEGTSIATIDSVEQPAQPGDTIFIPAGVQHCFRNASATDRLRILWTYGSIDASRTIVATGATHFIDEESAVGPMD